MIFRKKRTETETSQSPKEEYFDFDRIASYFQWKSKAPCFQNINDHTWADLDMDEVFTLLDRTHSRPGQQYLYYLMRSIPKDSRKEQMEQTIDSINRDSDNTLKLVKALKSLNKRGSYFLYNLFSRETIKKPKWFWVVHLLFALTILSIVGFFLYQGLFLVILLCVISNFIIHYWNKTKLMEYSNAIAQLYHLNKACKQAAPFLQDESERNQFSQAHQLLKSLTFKSSLLRDSSASQNEFAVVAEILVELVKAVFLIEPITLYHLTHEIERKQHEIEFLFERIGYIDACISISTIRDQYQYCLPTFTEERILITEDCRHPLLMDAVSNSIHIRDDHSILISGSNMSGKTTFIRTIGINALLGQSINTVFAKTWTFPKSRIFSAIRISDDLLNDESFYQKEVRVILEMIEEQQNEAYCLFLIDELYKGTNSVERIAAGAAVLSSLHNNRSIVCASTHDLELTEMLADYRNYHFTELVEESQIRFDYKLQAGKLQNTNAIRILETNGYPVKITAEAREIVARLKKSRS